MDRRIVSVLIAAAPSLKGSVSFTLRWLLPNVTFAL